MMLSKNQQSVIRVVESTIAGQSNDYPVRAGRVRLILAILREVLEMSALPSKQRPKAKPAKPQSSKPAPIGFPECDVCGGFHVVRIFSLSTYEAKFIPCPRCKLARKLVEK